MKLLIITQKVDEQDDILGFFPRWIEEFSRNYSDVAVIAQYVGGHSFDKNISIFSLGKERGAFRPMQLLNFYRLLLKNIRDADAVFVHMIPLWVIFGAPIFWIFNKPAYLWYTHKSVTPLLILAEKIVNKIFTASEESFRLSSRKLVITGHGIDLDKFRIEKSHQRSLAGEKLKIISIGRISPVKNYENLIKALVLIKRRASVIIMGPVFGLRDTSYLKKIKNIICESGLVDAVEISAPVPYPEIQAVYNNADLMIHLSRTGSVDKVVLEALACGLPVISSSEAFKKMLPHKYILSDDRPETIAEKIDNFIAPSDEERAMMADGVRRDNNLPKVISRISKEMIG